MTICNIITKTKYLSPSKHTKYIPQWTLHCIATKYHKQVIHILYNYVHSINFVFTSFSDWSNFQKAPLVAGSSEISSLLRFGSRNRGSFTVNLRHSRKKRIWLYRENYGIDYEKVIIKIYGNFRDLLVIKTITIIIINTKCTSPLSPSS